MVARLTERLELCRSQTPLISKIASSANHQLNQVKSPYERLPAGSVPKKTLPLVQCALELANILDDVHAKVDEEEAQDQPLDGLLVLRASQIEYRVEGAENGAVTCLVFEVQKPSGSSGQTPLSCE